jgi:hypothetical protein
MSDEKNEPNEPKKDEQAEEAPPTLSVQVEDKVISKDKMGGS